jgi:hypothetical protein
VIKLLFTHLPVSAVNLNRTYLIAAGVIRRFAAFRERAKRDSLAVVGSNLMGTTKKGVRFTFACSKVYQAMPAQKIWFEREHKIKRPIKLSCRNERSRNVSKWDGRRSCRGRVRAGEMGERRRALQEFRARAAIH